MKRYSITKYHKNKCDSEEEWTSVSDIGKEYNGNVLNIDEYMKVEDSYVKAVLEILRYMKIHSVRIKNVSRWRNLAEEVKEDPTQKELYSDLILNVYESVENDQEIEIETLDALIRLQLREDLGGLIYVPYRLKLFIGYDYMMGVHSSMNLRKLYTFISDLGLNIYEF